jgi:hypothetical protein
MLLVEATMYTQRNFKTKAELKRALAAGEKVEVFQPNDLFGLTEKVKVGGPHKVTLEGPHYPKPHTWYAEAVVEGGLVVKVK